MNKKRWWFKNGRSWVLILTLPNSGHRAPGWALPLSRDQISIRTIRELDWMDMRWSLACQVLCIWAALKAMMPNAFGQSISSPGRAAGQPFPGGTHLAQSPVGVPCLVLCVFPKEPSLSESSQGQCSHSVVLGRHKEKCGPGSDHSARTKI